MIDGVALLISLGSLCLAAAHADEVTQITPAERWEDLGSPVHRSRIYSQAVGRDTTGRELYYLGMVDAEETFVLALDPLTGQGRQINLTGQAGQVWMVCAHSNGKAYATTGPGSHKSGAVFELDPVAGSARLLGRAPTGEQVIWELYEASDGNLYGGTYPSCKLARVNLATGQIEDLGRMDPEQMYVRTIATEGDWVYCGCGVTRPAVWAYNIRTGEKSQLLPEAAREGAGWGRAMTRIDGRVYIYGNGETQWRVSGLDIEPAEMPRLPFYELADGTRLFTSDASGPEGQYLAVTPDGARHDVRFSYTCSGTKLWDVFPGPDGRVYGNTHTPITLFAYDPGTGGTQVFGDPVGHAGQVYASMWHQGKLHMAAYSDCTYTVWDPALPWQFGTEPGSNPRRLGKTSRNLQRAGSMIPLPDGHHVLVGGLPGYGRIGGALVLVDPAAASFEVIERPVGDQSPWALATTPDPDVVAVGTSLYGGSGSKPVDPVARLVLWNWRTREEVLRITPWEDETVISTVLRMGGELLLCGAPHGRLAVYDFSKGSIVRTADLGYGAGKPVLRLEDGMLYAFMGGRAVRIDPATLEHEVLGTYPQLQSAIALTGEYAYGICENRLVRLGLQ